MANFKDLSRLCKNMTECKNCPLCEDTEKEICKIGFISPCAWSNEIEEIIDKWVAEHPAKTYADDFFEKFPNAPKDDLGNPKCCLGSVYPEFDMNTCQYYDSCEKCWNQEMKKF